VDDTAFTGYLLRIAECQCACLLRTFKRYRWRALATSGVADSVQPILFSTSATSLPAGFVVLHRRSNAALPGRGDFLALPQTSTAARKDGVGVTAA
jgi:hypothetical protein